MSPPARLQLDILRIVPLVLLARGTNGQNVPRL